MSTLGIVLWSAAGIAALALCAYIARAGSAERIGAAVGALQAARLDAIAKTHSRDWMNVLSQLEGLDHETREANRLLRRVLDELRAINTQAPPSTRAPILQTPDFAGPQR